MLVLVHLNDQQKILFSKIENVYWSRLAIFSHITNRPCCTYHHFRTISIQPKLTGDDNLLFVLSALTHKQNQNNAIYCLWNAFPAQLMIGRVKKSDEGRYECSAENNIGIAFSYPAHLYVKGTSDINVVQQMHVIKIAKRLCMMRWCE